MEIQNIRNPVLYEHIKKLTKAFLNALDKPFFQSYGSWYDRIKAIVHGDPELISKILEKRPDLEEEKLSFCLVSIQRCVKALLDENICRKPPHASTKAGYLHELTYFLTKIFEEIEHMRIRGAPQISYTWLPDEIIQEEYLRYEKYLYDNSVSDFLICPIYNFRSSETITFETGIFIRKIKNEEFHNLVEAEEKYGYGLEYYPEFILYMPIHKKNWNEQLITLITALRLVKEGKIGLKRIYYVSSLPVYPWKILEAPVGTNFIEDSELNIFEFNKSEIKTLEHIWNILNQVKAAGYLTAAIRRFNFAYERERYEDSWVDFFISLESLYSKDSETTEVTHRLATRITKTLEKNSLEKRIDYSKKIKKYYRIRSRIVHGVQVKLSLEQIQDLEEIIRRSLYWFINHKDYANHNKIINLLDLK